MMERSIDFETVATIPVTTLIDKSVRIGRGCEHPVRAEKGPLKNSLASLFNVAGYQSVVVVEHAESNFCQDKIYACSQTCSLFQSNI
jgi:hypothetical protein